MDTMFQIRLRSWWDFRDEFLRIPWDPLYQEDPLWWSWAIQQREGVDLSLPVPDLSFYSDESDVSWGVLVGETLVSEFWFPTHKGFSINLRGMMAVQGGFLEFSSLLRVRKITPFCDCITTVAYLRRSGGTRSHTPGGGPGPSSPVASDHSPVCYTAVSKAPCALCYSMAFLQPWDYFGRYAFPPITLITSVLLKLRLSHLRSHPDRPPFGLKRMVSSSAGPSPRHSNGITLMSRSAATTAFPSVSRRSPFSSSDGVAPLKRFASQADFSETVAGHLALCRRNSRLNGQARGGMFRKWCRI